MKRTLLLILLCSFVPASWAGAETVEFGWETDVEYDSQVTSEDGGKDDVIFTMGPTFRLSGEHQRFNYTINYESAFEKYGEIEVLNDWDHRLGISGAISLHPLLSLRLSNNFTDLSRLRSGEDELDPEEIDPSGVGSDAPFNLSSGRIRNNSFTATLIATPTARLVLTGRVSHLLQEFDEANLNAQDTSAVSTEGFGTYRLNESHQIGAGFRFSRRDFSTGESSNSDSTTDTFQAYGIWTWLIDERSTFSLRMGPAWSDDDLQVAPQVVSSVGLLSSGQLAFAACDPALVFEIQPTGDPLLEDLLEIPVPPFGTVRSPGVIISDDCEPIEAVDPMTQLFTGVPQRAFTDEEIEILLGLDPLVSIPELDPENNAVTNDGDINLFVTLSLDRRWDKVRTSFSWNRSDSQTRALGSATIVDTVTWRTAFDVSARTSLNLNLRFSRRYTELDQRLNFPLYSAAVQFLGLRYPELLDPSFGGAFENIAFIPLVGATSLEQRFEQTNDNFTIQFGANRDVGRGLTVYSTATYRYQENELITRAAETKQTDDEWRLNLGFRYWFRPIRIF